MMKPSVWGNNENIGFVHATLPSTCACVDMTRLRASEVKKRNITINATLHFVRHRAATLRLPLVRCRLFVPQAIGHRAQLAFVVLLQRGQLGGALLLPRVHVALSARVHEAKQTRGVCK